VKKKLRAPQMNADIALRAAERLETVYRERAARLAIQRTLPETGATIEALVFTLGTERYAVELRDLVEVLPFKGCTPVPSAPEELTGVINIRGEILPVLDLSRVLTLPKVENRAGGWLLLLRRRERAVGFRVDQVEKIRRLRSDELADPVQSDAHANAGYLKAITADTVMLLSAERLLSHALLKENS
jgi:purine-binding chemotaxis protein CheW